MTDRRSCKDKELHQLTHPDEWPIEGLLPLARRGGNIVYNVQDVGIIMEDNLCCVWTGIYLGDGDPRDGKPEYYKSPEHVLSEWEID
jgi:hypothetical protein